MINQTSELPSKPKTEFQLPKMYCKELLYDKCFNELEELKNAKHSFSFLKTDENEYKCLFTGFGEEEFLMFCILVNRHVSLFNLLKLVILDTEKMRATPCEDHDFTYKALEYIKLKKLTNLNLELK
jgi:hypothetical protein